MSRPPLPVGTYGEIRCYRLGPERFRAIANYRDYDGVTRPVERVGKSEAKAKARLKEAFRDRARQSGGDEIHGRTKLSVVADLWLRDVDESGKASRTKQTYRESWERDLAKAVGALQVREMTVPMVDRVLRGIRDSTGSGSAKHAKVVLGGLLGMAVRHGVLSSNPVREVALGAARTAGRQDDDFVVTQADLPELRAFMRGSKRAGRADLVDVIDLLSVLGCRVGELLALDWSRVDFGRGLVKIEGTVIRAAGEGLFVQRHTKTAAGMRTLHLPSWALEVLRGRAAEATSQWVFPSSTGTLRDPENLRSQIRKVVAGTRWEGLHPHAFRHLVATMLDEAGLTARQIADYLGHEQVSMTQDVYMTRKSSGASAAAALELLRP
jgi:integrase